MLDSNWHISPYSSNGASCVETILDLVADRVGVRDSKEVAQGINDRIVYLTPLEYYVYYQPMLQPGGIDAYDESTWHVLEPLFRRAEDGRYVFGAATDASGIALYFTTEEVRAHILGLQDDDYAMNRRLPPGVEQILQAAMSAERV